DCLGIIGKPVVALKSRPDADLVDPPAEVGRRAHVRTDGDNAPCGLRLFAREVEQDPTECSLRGGSSFGRAAYVEGDIRGFRGRSRVTLQPISGGNAQLALGGSGVKPFPRVAFIHTQFGCKRTEFSDA